ncbi:hypothetical protein FUSNEC_GEN_10705_01285 [Fusobacterium necrophorum subsp. funduliforme]|uniref:hypothetical protein n=1 Tax=Fusobacterium necrophorum TaxID=859 RepID=UPI000B109F33|nr:hypothetical protein [Fusobacterium necrophorum]MDK4486442.1 hypothetical protein [Fusobacterium necrophorum]MDK4488830.1 hypothetical protein [Fusobacterium necrophorum]MDK4504928.1 hypothetical protein [Fusobacterium necrophorum]
MKEHEKVNVSLSTTFGVAAVWFGAHIGGGFATGNQICIFANDYCYLNWLHLL